MLEQLDTSELERLCTLAGKPFPAHGALISALPAGTVGRFKTLPPNLRATNWYFFEVLDPTRDVVFIVRPENKDNDLMSYRGTRVLVPDVIRNGSFVDFWSEDTSERMGATSTIQELCELAL